jgi:hypothetical protein
VSVIIIGHGQQDDVHVIDQKRVAVGREPRDGGFNNPHPEFGKSFPNLAESFFNPGRRSAILQKHFPILWDGFSILKNYFQKSWDSLPMMRNDFPMLQRLPQD